MSEHDGYLVNELRDEIANGQVVVLVGAGVSAGATRGAPVATWKGLLEHGARRCFDLGRLDVSKRDALLKDIEQGDIDFLVGAAEVITQKLGGANGGEFRRWLRESVGALKAEDRSVLEALQALRCPLATTNYDGLLTEVTGLPAVTRNDLDAMQRALRKKAPAILHLHGHWNDPKSVVLGVRSYEEVTKDEAVQALLRVLVLDRTLLFVGFGAGLRDANFGALLEWMRRVLRNSTARHYRLALQRDLDKLRESHPDDERIAIVPFGTERDHLTPFLRSLVPPAFVASVVPSGPVVASVVPSGPVVASVAPSGPVVASVVPSGPVVASVVPSVAPSGPNVAPVSPSSSSVAAVVPSVAPSGPSVAPASIASTDLLSSTVEDVTSRAPRPSVPGGEPLVLRFVPGQPRGYRVEIDGQTEPFTFDVGKASENAELRARIEQNGCTTEDLIKLGDQLWTDLHIDVLRPSFATYAKSEVDNNRPRAGIEVVIPQAPELQGLLLEALRERSANRPPVSVAWCELVEGDTFVADESVEAQSILIAIPEGSNLDHAQEVENIRNTWEASGAPSDAFHIVGSIVTRSALKTAIEDFRPTIVHFVGHGERDKQGSSKIRLNSADGSDDWIEAAQFARLLGKHDPKLVVLNCCLGAAESKVPNLSALGPLLLQQGVQAVVAMRHSIPNDLALHFSSKLYESLLTGAHVGQIQYAVEDACDDLFGHSRDGIRRAFLTPVLFVKNRSFRLFRKKGPVPGPSCLQRAIVVAVAVVVLLIAVGVGYKVAIAYGGDGGIVPDPERDVVVVANDASDGTNDDSGDGHQGFGIDPEVDDKIDTSSGGVVIQSNGKKKDASTGASTARVDAGPSEAQIARQNCLQKCKNAFDGGRQAAAAYGEGTPAYDSLIRQLEGVKQACEGGCPK